jgi:chromosome segregation ATPase
MGVITVNCPKCGFEQEQRLDCRKCGIIFSKYLALQSEPSGAASPSAPAENGAPVEILELRQGIRDLTRKFSEVEFERVERGQLKSDLRVLEKKVQTSLDQLSYRLEELEKLLSNPQAPPPPADDGRLAEVRKELLEANVDPLNQRVVRIEEKLDRWEMEILPARNSPSEEMSTVAEAMIGPLAARLAEVEQKLRRWEKDLPNPSDALTTEMLARLEARLAGLESRVESLSAGRQFEETSPERQNLQDHLSSMSDELTAVKASAERALNLQRDLSELSAENSRMWTQIQSLENRLSRLPSPTSVPQSTDRLELDIRSIRDGMQEIRDFIARATAKS